MSFTSTKPKLSPKTDLAAAIRYALGRWTALARYLDDGRLEIDNNAAERAIRPSRHRAARTISSPVLTRVGSALLPSTPGSAPPGWAASTPKSLPARRACPYCRSSDQQDRRTAAVELERSFCQNGGMSDVVRLKITLCNTEPAVWRRVEVPSAETLKDLHTVVQAAMGWDNYHPNQFQVGRQTINGPGFDDIGFSGQLNISAGGVGLGELIDTRVKRIGYLYDMGDSWEHELRIEKLLPAEPETHYPRFVDGAGACPPEDVGGLPGFCNFLEAMEDPKHPDRKELISWCGGRFDPNDLDQTSIKKRLARIDSRKKRKAASPH